MNKNVIQMAEIKSLAELLGVLAKTKVDFEVSENIASLRFDPYIGSGIKPEQVKTSIAPSKPSEEALPEK